MPDSIINPTTKKLIWLSRSGPAFEFPEQSGVNALAFLQAIYGVAWVAEFAGQGGSVALLAGQIRCEARRLCRRISWMSALRATSATDGLQQSASTSALRATSTDGLSADRTD